MLNKLARFFGLDRTPPPTPKRRPTARNPKAAKAVPAAPTATSPAPKPALSAIMLPDYALAVRTFIRQWGQHGPVPDAGRLEAAAYVLGRDVAAFLTALHLVDGRLTRFLVTEARITDPAANRGLRDHVEMACYAELDVWSDAEKADLKNRRIARQSGRPVPEPLHVPAAVREALLKRMREAAERVQRGGGAKGGGVKPAPPADMGAPVIDVLDAEGGGRGRIAASAEADEQSQDAAPAPRMGGGQKDEDDDERPNTLHMPPPPPKDGEPEAEGGGLGLPRPR